MTPLTLRDLEALQAVADGAGYKGAERLMGLHHQTLKDHLRSARVRLRAKNTTHAVAIAYSRGLIS